MTECNNITMGDNIYQMSRAYIDGARAVRSGAPYYANPFRYGSQSHNDWNNGHTHEAAGEHFRFGLDLLTEPLQGASFEEDPSVPRDADCNIDQEWIDEKLAAFQAV